MSGDTRNSTGNPADQAREKPSFLGLLNAIAVGEDRGHALLSAWARTTRDAAVRATLELVAAREREHAATFARRIQELGYSVRWHENPDFQRDLELSASAAPDREKFERLFGFHKPDDKVDPLARIFDDRAIDPHTGALLGRFIAEERDSVARLRACYSALVATTANPRHADNSYGRTYNSDDSEVLDALLARIDALHHTIDELKQIRSDRA